MGEYKEEEKWVKILEKKEKKSTRDNLKASGRSLHLTELKTTLGFVWPINPEF